MLSPKKIGAFVNVGKKAAGIGDKVAGGLVRKGPPMPMRKPGGLATGRGMPGRDIAMKKPGAAGMQQPRPPGAGSQIEADEESGMAPAAMGPAHLTMDDDGGVVITIGKIANVKAAVQALKMAKIQVDPIPGGELVIAPKDAARAKSALTQAGFKAVMAA